MNNILANFAPTIKGQVQSLVEANLGWTIFNPSSGSHPSRSTGYDRFILRHQLSCGAPCEWFVILNEQDPNTPADFVFGPEDRDFCSDRVLPSRVAWDNSKPTSLLNLILELRALWMARQKELVYSHCDATLKFNFETIEQVPGVEFLFSAAPVQLTCSIPLNVPLSKLVPDSTENDKARLRLKFSPSSTGAPISSFDLPSSWETHFPNPVKNIPKWPSEAMIIDYYQQVVTFFEAHCVDICFRRTVMAELSGILHHKAKQLNTDFWGKLTVTFERPTVSMLISLPSNFPTANPHILFELAERSITGMPIKHEITTMPWSPRWDPKEISLRLKELINAQLSKF